MLESDFWNLVVRYVSLQNLSKLEMIKIPEKVVIKHIDSIDENLPNITYLLNFQLPNITILDLSYRNLKKIPCLPKNLIKLYCSVNQLQNLHCLPDGLEYLWCFNNQIQTLPCLPNTLVQLKVSRNMSNFIKLIEIPEGCDILYV